MAERTQSPERLFGEEQVKQIFERAAVLEKKARVQQHGLTVAELETIAREAGIDPARVHEAIRELDAPAPQKPPGSGLLGGPLTRTFERRFAGELSEPGKEELVRVLRRLYGPGQISTVGNMITFTLIGPVMLEVSVFSRDGRTELHYGARYGQLAGGLYGGIVGGVGGAVGTNVGWMLPAFGHLPWWTGVMAGLGVVGGAWGLARSILVSVARKSDARLDEVIALLERETRTPPSGG